MTPITNNTNQSPLRSKLDAFIKRYHKIQLFRGLLGAFAILLSAFMFFAVLEYFGRFNSQIRTIMFFSFLALLLYVLYFNVLIPILRILRMRKDALNHETASLIVGNHFSEVKDKLLNTLQLESSQFAGADNELLLAAIQQKNEELSAIPFLKAISKDDLVKAGKYALIPLSVFILILLIRTGMVTESAQRLIQFQKHFAVPAPFEFVFDKENAKIFKNRNFTFTVKTKGKQIPQDLYLSYGGNRIKMESLKKGVFEFTLRNVQSTATFHFSDGKFSSEEYTLWVIPQPVILNFSIQLEYPAYLAKTSEKLQNIGDFTVPSGTKAIWKFNTKDADSLEFSFDQQIVASEFNPKTGQFTVTKKLLKDNEYRVYIKNVRTGGMDSLNYSIRVIPDQYPVIFSESQKDSVTLFSEYLFGEAADDYGISRITFYYKISGKNEPYSKIDLPVSGGIRQNFFLPVNIKDLGVKAEEELEYFFMVWDNDKVSGPKSTKTSIKYLRRESDAELEKQTDEAGKALVSSMKNALQKIAQLQEKIKETEKELLEKPNMTWEDKQKLDNLLEEQKKLQEQLEKLKEENKQRNQLENQFKNNSEELRKKQEQIEKMFNELLDEKTKDLFKKLEEMMKQQNKDKINQELNKLNKDNKDLEKMLDKTLEQFKKLELEKKLEEAIDKLNDLAEKQEELKKETENSDKNENQDLKNKQEQLQKEFEQLQKDLKDIDLKNKNLERPMKLDETSEAEKDIQKDMQDASDNIEKNKNKNAAQKQNEAADKMKDMAQKMKQNMDKNKEEQQEEDYQALRLLLKNLVLLSKKQEDIFKEFKEIRDYNPKYVELSKKQKELRQLSRMIEDSLTNLAKRQPMVSSYVTKETGSLVYNMEASIDDLSERRTQPAIVKQQYAMTHTNNLAVFLTEILKQMQDNMNADKNKEDKPQDGEPNESCDKPGKKGMGKPKPKPGLQGSQQLQERLNKMMEDMQKQMKEGKMPSSEEFAKIAAQQEALRKELENIEKQMKEDGQGGSELSNELKETRKMMEETETQLYNKKLDSELMKKQREISHRLFEHEKAEREQGEDEKRKGETAKEKERLLPPSIEKYLKEKMKEMEFYKTLPPEFSPYYKERVKEYYQLLQTQS